MNQQRLLDSQLITQQVALEMVGDNGKYQSKVLLLLCTCLAVISFHATGQSYLAINPPLLCDGQPCPIADYCDAQLITVDRSNYSYHSLTTEFELWCSRSTLATIAQSTYFLGSIPGAAVMSYVADQIGRRKAYLISWSFFFFGSISVVFSTSVYQYIISNFIVGFGGMPSYILIFVILNEMSASSFRQKGSIMALASYSMSELLTAIMYYLIPSWRYNVLIFIVLPAGFLFYCLNKILRETPSYYLSKGEIQLYYTALDEIAIANEQPIFTSRLPKIKHQLAENLKDHQRFQEVNKSNDFNQLDLFRYQSLRNPTLGFMLISFTLYLVYFGGQFSIKEIATGDNIYIMGGVMAIAELSGYLSVRKFIQEIPRQRSLIISYVFQIGSCSLFLLFGWSAASTQTDCGICSKSLQIIGIACLIRFFVSVGFAIQGIYINEFYPTCVRGIGGGFQFSVGVMGSFLSPYIIKVANVIGMNPYLLIGVICLASPYATLQVPETLGSPLKDQIKEERDSATDIELQSPTRR